MLRGVGEGGSVYPLLYLFQINFVEGRNALVHSTKTALLVPECNQITLLAFQSSKRIVFFFFFFLANSNWKWVKEIPMGE